MVQMKKRVSLLLSVLTLVLLLALAGCGGGSNLAGIWEAEIDLSDALNQELAGDEASEYVSITDFKMVLRLNLAQDGSYTLSVDQDALAQSADSVEAAVKDGIKAYLEKTMKDAAEQAGMTVDELLALSGSTMDELLAEAVGELELDDMAEGMEESGTYKADQTKLYFSDADSGEIDESGAVPYELSGDELRLTAGSEADDEALAGLLPIVFKRVG